MGMGKLEEKVALVIGSGHNMVERPC